MEMLQAVISRLASNSFALKGWAVTLVAGIFALSGNDAGKRYFLLAYMPIIVFWILDAYYLQQEKLYRALYDKVRQQDENKIDFCMDPSLPELKKEKSGFWECVISMTELGFYFPLAVTTAGIIYITHF